MNTLTTEARRYGATLVERVGDGWNRFWFAKSDSAPLGIVRIATGCLAFYWLATLSVDLVALFGPQGMLPAGVTEQIAGDGVETLGRQSIFRPSYLNYINDPTQLWAVHLLGLAIVAVFTAGWKTRFTSVAALIVVLATIHRGPQITGQFEPILTLVMFYLCLGPCGERFSIDAWLRRRKAKGTQDVRPAPSTWATLSLRLIQIHIGAVYLMMGIAKLADPSDLWWMGEAMWWVAMKPDSQWFDFSWLADHPYVVNAWTHGQVAFEIGFGLLIWNRLARPLMLAIAVPVWLLLAAASGWTPFCLMMLAANLAFISPRLILAVTQRRKATAAAAETPEPLTV